MIEQQDDFAKKVEYGLKKGAYQALDRHKRLGQSIIIYKEGKIISVPPDEIELPSLRDNQHQNEL